MTKDRLGELLKVQNRKCNDIAVDVEHAPNEDGNDLRKCFERAEVIGQWIDGLDKNIEVVCQYINKLDDLSINHRDLTEKIEELFQNNTSICHKINEKLKHLDAELKNIDKDTAEGRIKTIQYNTLRTRYTNTFKKNNNELENYRNIQKSRLEAQLIAKGVKVTDEELVALLDGQADIQLFTENILTETAEAKRVLADIEARHQQLLKIERMLVEVRDLFLQMAILIEAQQDLVDRVEYQAESAREYVGKAPKILSSAVKKKRKNLKCKIYLGIAVIILIMIILVLLFK